jgi:hypothetical protein
LIAERLPCSSWHNEEQVAALDGGAADWFLVGAKAHETEDRVEKLDEVFGIEESGQIAEEPSEDKGAFFNFTETGTSASLHRLRREVTSLVQQIRDLIGVEVVDINGNSTWAGLDCSCAFRG